MHLTGGRRKAVLVSEDFFVGWLTTSEPDEWKTVRCTDGLPDGARLVGVVHDPERKVFPVPVRARVVPGGVARRHRGGYLREVFESDLVRRI
jgi:hypothetical protein